MTEWLNWNKLNFYSKIVLAIVQMNQLAIRLCLFQTWFGHRFCSIFSSGFPDSFLLCSFVTLGTITCVYSYLYVCLIFQSRSQTLDSKQCIFILSFILLFIYLFIHAATLTETQYMPGGGLHMWKNQSPCLKETMTGRGDWQSKKLV